MTYKEKLSLYFEKGNESKFDLEGAQLEAISYPLVRVQTDTWDSAKFRCLKLSNANLINP